MGIFLAILTICTIIFLLNQYISYSNVIIKENVEKLSLSQNINYAIELKLETISFFNLIYNIFGLKFNELKNYYKTLDKDFIAIEKSFAEEFILFEKKLKMKDHSFISTAVHSTWLLKTRIFYHC